mmetsp:Transcript_49364/g.97657  ORF Transcript_49364/g.97657 Transcript_49364/m.97657 type:complete len:223 (-) Transcript_49364:243-911(-)
MDSLSSSLGAPGLPSPSTNAKEASPDEIWTRSPSGRTAGWISANAFCANRAGGAGGAGASGNARSTTCAGGAAGIGCSTASRMATSREARAAGGVGCSTTFRGATSLKAASAAAAGGLGWGCGGSGVPPPSNGLARGSPTPLRIICLICSTFSSVLEPVKSSIACTSRRVASAAILMPRVASRYSFSCSCKGSTKRSRSPDAMCTAPCNCCRTLPMAFSTPS